MSDAEAPRDAAEELAVGEESLRPQTPVPTATGNDAIAVYHHNFVEAYRDSKGYLNPAHVILAIGNETATHYAAVDFEAQFLDQEGNAVGSVRHTESDLRPDRSRGIRIISPVMALDVVQSYAIRIIRTTTVDFEQVQLRRSMAVTTEDGEERISGTVKNISDAPADAALVARFYNENNESIGLVVHVLRAIEPTAVREYAFGFKPQEGETVHRCTVHVGRLVE